MGAPVVVSRVVVGLDLEHDDERRADHDLQQLVRDLPGAPVVVAATHWAQGEHPHVALSVELAGSGVEELLQQVPRLADRWCVTVDGGVHGGSGGGVHVEVHGDAGLAAPADGARRAHVERRSGRLVHFPGAAALVGTLTVQDVLERSAVDRVQVLTAGDAPADAPLVTRDHVRPTWSGGAVVLLVQPAVGGTLVPFESPDPTPCCVDH